MTLTQVQVVAPSAAASGSTVTCTYTPLGVENIVIAVVDIQSARTSMSVASANASWTLPTTAMVALSGSDHLAQACGVVSSITPATFTWTFSGTPGTGPQVFFQEYDSSLNPLSWSFVAANNNNGTSTAALSAALAGGQKNDAYVCGMTMQNAATGTSNPQGYLTYDTTVDNVYGQLPAAATVPATGFTQTSGLFVAFASLMRPTLPALWTPPSVGMGIN